MTKPRNQTVASFGPEMLQALLRGAKESFEIGPMEYRAAVRFSQRLASLRQSMRAEEHPQFDVVARTRIRLRWGEAAGFPPVEEYVNSKKLSFPVDRSSPTKVFIEPYDSEFTDVLTRAGIEKAELPGSDPLQDFSPTPLVAPEDHEDFLAKFEKEKKQP